MRKLLILFITIIISGCMNTYVPPMPPMKNTPNAKLGLLVNISNSPTHTHVGTTIFNNNAKKYDHDWQMQSRVTELVTKQIESTTQYEVVDLSFLTPEETARLNFAVVKDKQWQLIEENKDLRQKLLDKDINAFISIVEAPTLAQLACSQYGCTEHYSQGQGLYTRSFFGLDTYLTSASYIMNAEILDSPVDLFMFESLRDMTGFAARHIELEDFKDPVDFKNITAEEMLPVRDSLEKYLGEIVVNISKLLNGEVETP